MGAVSYRARSELRVRWRPRLALAVLVGAFAGLATAAAAGGQATDTVVARSLRTFLSPEIFAVPAFTQNGDLLRFDTIRAFPEVATAFRSPMFFDAEDVDVGAFPSDQFGVVTSGSKLLAGRLPHPDDPEEVVMNFLAAERLH